MSLEFPLSQLSKGSIENAKFAKIQARTIIGGLPVFTATRDISINKPTQAEMWIEAISGSPVVCIYYSGVKYILKTS